MPVVDSGVEFVREVLVRGPIARSDLSSALGLSSSSLTRLARPYIASGLLTELPEMRDGSLGRPTRPLVVSETAGRVVGVKLTGDHAHLVLVDMRANEIGRRDEALSSTDPERVVEQLARLVHQLATNGPDTPLRGIGVCLGGNVSDDGVVLRAPYLGWRSIPFADMLEREAGVPVVVENDVVALTEAEYLVGSARGISNFSVITIGKGVGYGLVINEQVLKTADTGLGLGGHIPLDATGPYCPDGHRGCARAMLSSESMCAQARIALGRDVSYAELLTLAAAGEGPAHSILSAAATALGRFVALSANLTMHSTVVLSGDGIGLWTGFEETVRAAAALQRDPEATPLNIIVDTSGFEAWARGAAAVSIERSLSRLAQ